MSSLYIRRMNNGDVAMTGILARGNQALAYIDAGDVREVKLDLSDMLPSAGSISTVSTAGSGLTISTPSAASGVITFTVTGPSGSGYQDITATLSNGEKITQRLHVIEAQPTLRQRDYVG